MKYLGDKIALIIMVRTATSHNLTIEDATTLVEFYDANQMQGNKIGVYLYNLVKLCGLINDGTLVLSNGVLKHWSENGTPITGAGMNRWFISTTVPNFKA